MTLTLNSPITDEQWDAITDVNFEHTDRIWFKTKHGKEVEFVKQKKGKWEKISDRNYKCTCCGAWWTVDRDSTTKDFAFCPSCGAQMERSEE